MKEQIIQELAGKKVLILGFGREGQSTYNFIQKNNIECKLAIADKNYIDVEKLDKKVTTYTGENYMDNVLDYDVVIKSPRYFF